MLTSNNSNQYLRPEYLSPLPTTLDAKKSPLALLAQTCSQIGADPPVIPSANKSSLLNGTSSSHNNNHETHSSLSGKSKSSGSHHHTKDSHPTNRKQLRSTSTSPGPIPEKISKKSNYHPMKKNDKDDTSTTSPLPINTVSIPEKNDKIPSNNNPSSKGSSPNPTNPSPPSSSSSSSSSSTSNPRNKSPPTSSSTTTPTAADSVLSTKSFGSVSETLATSTPSILPPTSTKLNFSNLNFNSASSIDLALKHGLPFPGLYPPVPSSTGTGIPPYLHSYARLKAAAAANGLNSECRDPFCTGGCHLGSHGLSMSGLKNCPAGCITCDHHKNPFGSFPFLPGLPPFPPGLGSLYSSSNSTTLQPYVCNWFVGDSYCGKRFSSSDDLLHHLRSHTTSLGNGTSQEAVQNLAVAAMAAGYPPSGFFPPSTSHHPLLGPAASHGLLNRTYPTPPLSPLSGRFHPYAKGNSNGLNPNSLSSISSPSVTSSFFPPGFPPLGHPAFSPYYPYSLYGQSRLGSASGSLHQ